jgi:hypothetical protein
MLIVTQAGTHFNEMKGRFHPVISVWGFGSGAANPGLNKKKTFIWEPGNSADFKI